MNNLRKQSRNQDEDATPKKWPKRHSLKDLSLKKDENYIPSSTHRDRLNRPRVQKTSAPRSPKGSLRDPFVVLDDDLVFLIINQLSAHDTEVLRKVSKLWKASSEAHCGRNALLQHCISPPVVLNDEIRLSREEENLRYRRHLYYQESLRRGYASRAIKCTGAMDWHISQDTLTWSNKSGDVSIRKLRIQSKNTFVNSEMKEIDLRDMFTYSPSIRSVQPICGGDLIVGSTSQEYSNPYDATLYRGEYIARISQEKLVVWKVESKICVIKPAIGEDALYFIQLMPPHGGARVQREAKIVKINLQDGSVLFSIPAPMPDPHLMVNLHWRLTSNEKFLIWKGSDASIYVISTSSGGLIDSYTTAHWSRFGTSLNNDQHWHIDSTKYCRGPFLGILPGACDECSMVVSYEEDCRRKQMHIFFLFDSWHRFDWSAQSLDLNKSIFLGFHHINDPTLGLDWRLIGQQPTDPLTTVWIQLLDETIGRHKRTEIEVVELTEKWPLAEITLPDRSQKVKGNEKLVRRKFEVDVPWTMEEEDFFGIKDNYLIYHSPAEEMLLLVDFWPSW